MGAEGETLDGFHIWTDMYFIEMLDLETGEPVPQGQTGTLIVTPLWTNNATPFLRWNSGDLVTHEENAPGSDRFSVFPRIKHTHRTPVFTSMESFRTSRPEALTISALKSLSGVKKPVSEILSLPKR